MTCGVYYYWDKEKDEFAYIGQSIDIERRHKQHLTIKESSIPFDKILQNNPERYEHNIMLHCKRKDLNKEEELAVDLYQPKFNFKKGGQTGEMSLETRKKISETRIKKGLSRGKNNCSYGGLSQEHKDKISKSHMGKVISKEAREKMSKTRKKLYEDPKNHPMYGYKHKTESKNKMSLNQSKNKTTSGYYRVFKKKDTTCKQNFRWIYSYTDNAGKRWEISSVDIKKLESKVKSKGLKWLKFDE